MERLPRYAVPMFVRVVEEKLKERASHNYKPLKGPLRYGCVETVSKGTEYVDSDKDRILWPPPQESNHVVSERTEWDALLNKSAKL